MGKVVCWTDKGGCSSCKYCGMDMDPFCVYLNVVKENINVD